MTTYIMERYLKEGGRRICVITAPNPKLAIAKAADRFGASDDWNILSDSTDKDLFWSTIVKF